MTFNREACRRTDDLLRYPKVVQHIPAFANQGASLFNKAHHPAGGKAFTLWRHTGAELSLEFALLSMGEMQDNYRVTQDY